MFGQLDQDSGSRMTMIQPARRYVTLNEKDYPQIIIGFELVQKRDKTYK